MSPNLLNKYVWLVEAIDNAKKSNQKCNKSTFMFIFAALMIMSWKRTY